MSNEDLKEKLERWFEPNPYVASPVHAGAIVLGMKNRIENEEWENDEVQREAIIYLGTLFNLFHHLDHFERYGAGDIKLSKQVEKILESMTPLEKLQLEWAGKDGDDPAFMARYGLEVIESTTKRKQHFISRTQDVDVEDGCGMYDLSRYVQVFLPSDRYPREQQNRIFELMQKHVSFA